MSHELRTPLNAIIGFSEMIKDGVLGPISPPNYANYAKDINNAAVHLLGIVTQILDMANLESGEMRLRITEFELKDVLEESIEIIRSTSAEDRRSVHRFGFRDIADSPRRSADGETDDVEFALECGEFLA